MSKLKGLISSLFPFPPFPTQRCPYYTYYHLLKGVMKVFYYNHAHTHTHTPWFLTSYRTALNTIFFETEFHNILELNTHLITFYKWD